MRALTWHGKHDVRVDTVDDPEILNPRDAIIRITSTAICGSDLHLYDGYIPTMKAGDILGHEFMGEVVEIGAKSSLKKGQRVVVPFTIACGSCYHCGSINIPPATMAIRPTIRIWAWSSMASRCRACSATAI
jgi:threonine dehydrogenase-like Zn-dependent dehydrogenase